MRFQVYPDRGKKWRWRLRARNGQIVAVSGQSFANKWNAWRALRRWANYLQLLDRPEHES